MENKAPWSSEVPPEELRRIVDVLYRVHRFVAAITDLDTLLEHIMEESKQVANAEACSLMLYDDEAGELYFEVALGESGDQQALKREVRLKLGQGVAGAAAATRESINVPDVSQDDRFYSDADVKTSFHTRSLLAVPLVDHDQLVGVLELLNKNDGGPFTETDLRIMEMFSGLVATVIANARLIDENLRAARMAAVGQAVAGLSHYGKNILAGMGGSVDLIDEGLKRDNMELLLKSWPILRRSVRRISNLVENMLAYSKAREPIREECRIPELIKDVTEMFWGLLARKHVELAVDTAAVEGPAYLDQNGLLRCLLNLLTNAADAVENEGGKIWVTARTLPDGQLEIDVRDNGPGIDEEDIDRVFDLFYSTKGSKGTGLGLAVTHKIVHEHGGEISVGRGPEGGARFCIVLPCQEDRG